MRRLMQNEQQVARIPLRHAQPLRCDFMAQLRNMLLEALELLKDTEASANRDMDAFFGRIPRPSYIQW